ncbi:MAG: TRAP transporter large permease subunit, partial [Rhodobacteraceae bacterium]|nr:TRAP transporter large permease subunit [Paracoccaceae bacterium]
MDPITIVLLGMGALFVLIALHFPIGVAMAIVGVVGFWMQIGVWGPALSLVGIEAVGLLTNTELAVIPLFLLMGSFATAGGLSRDIFELINAFLGHRRGGLAMATVGGCAVFGSICGSSPATAATFGRVALPEMRRLGYAPTLAGGSIAAGGTLGSLVPPSIVMVIYAVITEQFILDMFVAAVIPAILAVVLSFALIWIMVVLRPRVAPPAPRPGRGIRGGAARRGWRVG